MRRRVAEHRRPVRRKFSRWISFILVASFLTGLVLFAFHHYHYDSPLQHHLQPRKGASFEGHEGEKSGSTIGSFSRHLTDQITLAKAYIFISKERNNLHLAWNLSEHVRKGQFLLSKSATQGKPVPEDEVRQLVMSLSQLISDAQEVHYDVSTTMATMKSHIQALEARVDAGIFQSSVFGQLVAEAVPKDAHCLAMRLTSAWLGNPSLKRLAADDKNTQRLVDNNLCHFCIFSDNLLATSVVINSTISNAEHPQQIVFHIVTSPVSYPSMEFWILSNNFKGATIEVQNLEDFSWFNTSYSNFFGGKSWRSKYASFLNHLCFLIPEIYPLLEKVVFLDDDVVVQKDLTPLFSLDLHGNVNGAVETCLESFHRYYKYLNFSNPIISSAFDPQACAWALGMNIFDLVAWKKANVTGRYRYWLEQNRDQTLWNLGTLPVALLAFYGLTEPIDRRWHLLGFGYDADIDDRLIDSAAVIHFNGHMKPWLKLGFARYKPLWEKYVNTSNPYYWLCFLM